MVVVRFRALQVPRFALMRGNWKTSIRSVLSRTH